MADKTECFWVTVHVGGRPRNLGVVMTAGVDAPPWLRGRRIFYRPLKQFADVVMRADNTTGVDSVCFDFIKDKVEFIVTYAAAERIMFAARPSTYTRSANYGQGLQQRAPMDSVLPIRDVDGLSFPQSIPRERLTGDK